MSCSASEEARRLADVIHGRLVELGRNVAVAESLTGGLISAVLTEAAGTSVTFRGGLVVYATDLKHSLAGVDADALEGLGPVDSTIAEQLASGARLRLAADYGIGVTGVAGPGEQAGRPVGEVYIAIAEEASSTAQRYGFDGTRDEIRWATVATALRRLTEVLTAETGTR